MTKKNSSNVPDVSGLSRSQQLALFKQLSKSLSQKKTQKKPAKKPADKPPSVKKLETQKKKLQAEKAKQDRTLARLQAKVNKQEEKNKKATEKKKEKKVAKAAKQNLSKFKIQSPETGKEIKTGSATFRQQRKKGNLKVLYYFKQEINNRDKRATLLKKFKTNNIKLPKSSTIENLTKAYFKHLNGDKKEKLYKFIGTAKFDKTDGSEVVANVNFDVVLPHRFDLDTGIDSAASVIERKMFDTSGDLKELEGHFIAVRDATKQDMANVKNQATRLHTKLIGGVTNIKVRDGFCVPDAVWHQVKGKSGFKTYSQDKFMNELGNYCDDIYDGVSCNELIKWAESEHPNISIYCLDPFLNVFRYTTATNWHNMITLCFWVNNGHVYPILDEEQKKDIRYKKRLDLDIHLKEFQFNVEHGGEEFNFITEDNEQDFIEGKLKGKVFMVKDTKTIDLAELAGRCIEHTNNIDCFFHPKPRSGIDAFQHPETKQVVIEAKDYDLRKKICDQLRKENDIEDFRRKNQSFVALANSVKDKVFNLSFIKCTYNKQTRDILDKFMCKSIIQTLKPESDDIPLGTFKSLDVCKSFSQVFLTNTSEYPIFDFTCKVEKFDGELKCGVYYIDRTTLKCGIVLEAAFYSWNLMKYLLTHFYIKKEQIKYQVLSAYHLKPEYFKELVEYLYTEFPDQAKHLVNGMNGCFASRYEFHDKFCITDSLDVLMALICQHEREERDFGLHPVNQLFFFRSRQQTRKPSDDLGVYSHVISGGIINLLKLTERLGEEDELFSVNTDAIYYVGEKYQDKLSGNVLEDFGKVRKQDVKRVRMWSEPEEEISLSVADFPVAPSDGIIYTGQAGCGKTQTLKEKYLACDNGLVLCPTNKACDNVNERVGEHVAFTFDSYIQECLNFKQKMDRLKGKTVFVDEFTMVSKKWMNVLYQAWAQGMLYSSSLW